MKMKYDAMQRKMLYIACRKTPISLFSCIYLLYEFK